MKKSQIKALVMDVDGTLTDGSICIGNQGEVMKSFNVKDGYAIAHYLPLNDIIPIIITGRKSDIVEYRSRELGIKEIHQGVHNKLNVLETILKKYDIILEEVAYIGDDVNDLQCMNFVGYSACPNDAVKEVKNIVKYICKFNGGQGAVREFIELIIE